MSTQFFSTSPMTLLDSTVHFLGNYWLSLTLLTLSGVLLFLTAKKLQRLSKKPESQNAPTTQRQDFSNLYNRIHNFQTKHLNEPTAANATTDNNPTTNSHYHHVIKLLQRGMDRKTLLEYCNLTIGEIELLEAIYGNSKGAHHH